MWVHLARRGRPAYQGRVIDDERDPAAHERASERATVGIGSVLVSMVILWAAYFAMATARGLVLGFDLQGEMLGRRFLVTLAGIAVTVLLWLLLRGFDQRRLGIRIVAAILAAAPAALLLAAINQRAFADIEVRTIEQIGEEQGVRIRRDEAGNLLVDIPGLPQPPAPPAPPDPGRSDGASEAPEAEKTIITSSHVVSPGPNKLMWQQLTDIALGRYYLLLSWCALYIAMSQAVHARLAERREGEYRRAAKAAELKSLRYQVNPHFLFNTLNSLSALVMTGRNDKAESMIQAISAFYRRSLSGDPTDDVALAEEIELQRVYLQIESVRFPERLRIEIDVPERLAAAQVPGMILQPLIENSVRYGVAAVTRPVTIRLAAAEEYERLVLTVSDDGPGANGADENGNANGNGGHGFGIGLANVRDRLRARFGDAASVVSGPGQGDGAASGWRTVIRMPLTRAREGG